MEVAKFATHYRSALMTQPFRVRDIYAEYRKWKAERGEEPRPPVEMASAFATVFGRLEVARERTPSTGAL